MPPTTIQLFGTSELPIQIKTLPPYQAFLPFESISAVQGALCYVIRHYGQTGFSVYIGRRRKNEDVDITVITSDWSGNKIDLNSTSQLAGLVVSFLKDHLKHLIELMTTVRLESAQYYFASNDKDVRLVDVRLGEKRFCGPGMVRDILGKIMPIQEVLKVSNLDDNTKNLMLAGHGVYASNLIIKPSRFRVSDTDGNSRPLYIELKRG